MTLPDCMMPDGGDGPCVGYQELEAQLAERDRRIGDLLAERARAVNLLIGARCPDCDGSGAGQHPCQWCDYRAATIDAARGE